MPSVNFQHGDTFLKPLVGEAADFYKNYTQKFYHQPSDEYHEWWDTSAMVQEAEFALAIGNRISNSKTTPRYKQGDEFAAADRARFKQR